MKDFLKEIYVPMFANLLAERAETFQKIFEYLQSLKKETYFILETGVCREPNNFAGDGMSTVLFDSFVNFYDGSVTSIDIDEQNVAFAKTLVSLKTRIVCSDSVSELKKMSDSNSLPVIDLLYLDSYDVDWADPHPSAFHHIKELLSILRSVSKGTLIVVDDNINGVGKGKYISQYMDDVCNKRIFDGYQIGWVW
jgi:hypothetical protein